MTTKYKVAGFKLNLFSLALNVNKLKTFSEMRVSLMILLFFTHVFTVPSIDTVPSVECFMCYKWCQLRNLSLLETQVQFTISISSNFISTGLVMFVNSSFPVLTSVVCDTFRDTKHLHASNQSIQRLENDTFVACPFLQYVSLDHNQIKTLPEGIFVNNKRLEMIQLQANLIKTLPVAVFHHLRGLQFLQLDRNQLVELPIELFKDAARLKYLTIFSNPLIELDAEKMIEYLPNVQLISLRDLDMQCDRMNDVMDAFGIGSVIISKFTEHEVRKRDYQPQSVKGVECLSDQQYERVLEIREQERQSDENNK